MILERGCWRGSSRIPKRALGAVEVTSWGQGCAFPNFPGAPWPEGAQVEGLKGAQRAVFRVHPSNTARVLLQTVAFVFVVMMIGRGFRHPVPAHQCGGGW